MRVLNPVWMIVTAAEAAQPRMYINEGMEQIYEPSQSPNESGILVFLHFCIYAFRHFGISVFRGERNNLTFILRQPKN